MFFLAFSIQFIQPPHILIFELVLDPHASIKI